MGLSGAARYMKDERMATMEVATQDQTRLLQEYQGQLLVLLTQRNLHLDIPKEDLVILKQDLAIHKEDLDICKEDQHIHKEDLHIHKEDMEICKQEQVINRVDQLIPQVQEIFLAKNHFFLQATFHPVLLVVSITL